MRSTAATVALGFGVVYVLIGLVGLALTGFSDFVSTEGELLLVFEVNPLHNLVHLGIGAGLIAGAMASSAGLRAVAWTIGAVYLLVGIVGFFIMDTSANILALNAADNLLHIGTALVLFWVAAQTPRMAAAT